MFLTPEMAEAFGDQIECERLRHALAAALPEPVGPVRVDEARPLLRIGRTSDRPLLVARAADESQGRWIIGIPGGTGPTLHAAATQQEVIDIVLAVLDQHGSGA